MSKRGLKLSKTNKIVEEHVSPGGKTRFTTKPGATDAAKRKALGRAREAQNHRAPREAAKRARETGWGIEEKTVISPGGQTIFTREMTPEGLKPVQCALPGSPGDEAMAFVERERRLLTMRQSKRLLDARARNEAAAAQIRDDGRLALGLKLLREAVAGRLAGSSDIQVRGALVNALVCLKTPDSSEYTCEGLGNDPWNQLEFPDAESKFYRERNENAELLVKAGCCGLVTDAVGMHPRDTNVAHAAFALANFLLTGGDDGSFIGRRVKEDVALMFCKQGMVLLALHALLRPFDAWSSTDFRSAGNTFRAVSIVDSTRPWQKELDEFVNSRGWDKTTGIAHTTQEEIHARFGKQMEEDPEPEWEDGKEPFCVLPEQPCRERFCCDWGDTSRAQDFFAHGYPKLYGHKICQPMYREMCFDVSAFVMHLFCSDVGLIEPYLPTDFAVQWSRRLSQLFVELLADNLAGYRVQANNAMCTLSHCFEITVMVAKKQKWCFLLRASGCFVLANRVANTAAPFPGVHGPFIGSQWGRMRESARRVAAIGSN